MRISLATSLHLDHGAMSVDRDPDQPPPMQSFVPVGLLALKGYAEAAGVDASIRVVEVNRLVNEGAIANDEQFYEAIVDHSLREDESFLGMMTDADSLHHTLLTARAAKVRSPETVVCLGGPAVSPIAQMVLERFPFVDYVVRGEGEKTFVELIEALQGTRDPAGILGLTYRNGGIHHNPDRPVIDDLDALPFLDLADGGTTAESALYLDVGRGCPFKCHFCATAPFWHRKYRMKSITRIVAEMTAVRDEYGRQHMNFSHDIFTCNRIWTARFCEALRDADLGVTWSCSTRTDVIDEELLADLAAAGCVEIYYGIETGSDAMQDTIHKNLDLERSREIVAATRANGIRPVTGFIVGYPTETPQSLEASLDRFFEFLEIGGFRAHLFTLCPFHEAPLYAEGHPVDRRAQCFDVPLLGRAAGAAVELQVVERDVFCSNYRYTTPELPGRFVDAAEELSSRLVVLKSVWPLLLPSYRSSFDWYTRWVDWIETYNRLNRPTTELPRHGEVDDLLLFLEEEIARLGLQGSDVAALVEYERTKYEAATALNRVDPGERSDAPVGDAAVVERIGPLILKEFPFDISRLLRGLRQPSPSQQPHVVVFANPNGTSLQTLQVGEIGHQILSVCAAPTPVADVVDRVAAGGARSPAACRETIERFAGMGLLRVSERGKEPVS